MEPQSKPEPMEIKNRTNSGYKQGYNKYQNKNYNQNKLIEMIPITFSKVNPKIIGYQLEVLTDNIEEDHFF